MAFTESLKLAVKRRAYFQCCLCKALGVEVHHIVPQAAGGSDDVDNAAPMCPSCHEAYGANPEKRKFIRECRDFWYEVCASRFVGDPNAFAAISEQLDRAVTKDDLARAVKAIEGVMREVTAGTRAPKDTRAELSSVSATASHTVTFGRECRHCKAIFGVVVGDATRCPQCKMPW